MPAIGALAPTAVGICEQVGPAPARNLPHANGASATENRTPGKAYLPRELDHMESVLMAAQIPKISAVQDRRPSRFLPYRYPRAIVVQATTMNIDDGSGIGAPRPETGARSSRPLIVPMTVAVLVPMLYSMTWLFARLAMKRLPFPSEVMPSGSERAAPNGVMYVKELKLFGLISTILPWL